MPKEKEAKTKRKEKADSVAEPAGVGAPALGVAVVGAPAAATAAKESQAGDGGDDGSTCRTDRAMLKVSNGSYILN